MKKRILILTILALGAFCHTAYAQVISTTIVALQPQVNSIVVIHLDSTMNPTDTFWSNTDVSQSSSLALPIPGKKTKWIGGGLHYDTLTVPLVEPGTQYWTREKIANDSLMTNYKVSNIQTATPRYPIDSPTIVITTHDSTTSSVIINYSWNSGHDSAKITFSTALDSNYTFTFDSIRKVTGQGTGSYAINGIQSGKKVYVRVLIQNSFGSKTIQLATGTVKTPEKPWLREVPDSIKLNGTTIDIYGRGIGYGISTFVQASSGTLVSNTDSLGGSGEASYHIRFSGLTLNTTYSNVTIKAQNAKGSVTINLGTLRTLAYDMPTVFTIVTDSAIRASGATKVRIYGHVSVPKNTTASIYVALFPDNSCSVSAYQKENPIVVHEGVTQLDWTFDVDTLTPASWGKFWGFDDQGGFDLDGKPVNVKVVNYQVFQTGVTEVVKKDNMIVFPNPCNDVLNVPSYGKFEILDITGKKIMDGFLNEWEKQISVSYFARGTYVIKIQSEDGIHTAKFIKN